MSENAAQPSDEEGKEGRENLSLFNAEGKEGRKSSKQRRGVAAYDADYCNASNSTRKREINGIILACTKPSYCLQRGVGSSQQRAGCESLRSLHRKKLWRLLKKLLLNNNWAEASGVLSVLLKGTARETSISRNGYKYWATLELMHRIKGETFNQRKIQNVYELWMRKLGPMKNHPTRFAVQLESIIYCLKHGKIDDAYQGALCLMQERGFESNSLLNLIVGLTFYELWYTAIPKDMQLGELSKSGSPMQSQVSEGRRYLSVENYEGYEAVEAQDRNFPLECDSITSIGNEKDGLKVQNNQSKDVFMEVDYKEQEKTPVPGFQAQGFYIKPSESSGHEGSSPNHIDHIPTASIFYTRGLPPWMLPLQLPDSTEDLENFLCMHRNLQNDNYRNAVKYLRVALYSEPPMLEAFHPLIQLLLLGDQVKEALNVIEILPQQNPDTALRLRLKTDLLEHFDPDSYAKLSKHFENILKKDPTSRESLTKLLCMHQRGDYGTERLVEMIALHLDATFADCNIWKELASCLFKLSQCEEDEMSTCFDRDDRKQQHLVLSIRIPAIFTNSESLYAWRLRCRWWLTRHFSLKTLQSDISSGEVQLVTYKAAAATHLYGREVKYVIKTTEYLERENNLDMLFILSGHIQNSVGFYFSLRKKDS